MQKNKKNLIGWVVSVLAVSLSVFSLYTGAFGMLPSLIQKPLHLMCILTLTFLLYPFKKSSKKATKAEFVFNGVLILASVIPCIWLMLNYKRYYMEIFLDNTGVVMGTILCLSLFEATRRTLGWALSIIGGIFFSYATFGGNLPGILAHSGNEYERVINTLYATTIGIFGIPLSVCATFIILFVIFGALLNVSGAAKGFMDMALAIAGRSSGGVAKVAVISSALMGMISGSTVANVATTGAVTIPMMKKRGYPDYVAGAIEAVASTGGQFTPPIMGAAAFIIAEFIGVSYMQVVWAASFPAALFYICLYFVIHYGSIKMGILGIPKEETPSLKNSLLESIHLVAPVSVLVVLMVLNYTPMYAALWAIFVLVAASMVKKSTRFNLKRLLLALEKGATTMIPISAACATAGLVVGVLAATGLGIKFSYLLTTLSGDNFFVALLLTMLAALLLGMGLPTAASYMILASIGAPALIEMGGSAMGVHLFIFYFAIISNITPPVCLASYAASGLAGAGAQKTAFQAVRMSIILYIIPFCFVFNPELIMEAHVKDILIALPTYILGVIAAASAIEGYLIVESSWLEKITMPAASIGLLYQSRILSVIGFVLFAAVYILQYVRKKSLK
jgi:TRAP transporter 4TM/12TM fusion protein